MNDINQMREALKRTYPSARFATKVNLMAPDMVTAMYLRLKENDKLK